MDLKDAKVIQFVKWTEYERGFGQRPDGMTYAEDEAKLKAEIKRQESLGDSECFSRASPIQFGLVNPDLYAEIQQKGTVTTWSKHHDGFIGIFTPGN